MPSRYAAIRLHFHKTAVPRVYHGVVSNADRRQKRFKRRQAKRAENRRKRLENVTLENIADLNNLEKAAKEAARGVGWKANTQRYLLDRLSNVLEAHDKIMAGEDFTLPRFKFDIVERGKLRHIQAAKFRERVIQKSLARNAMLPAYMPSMTSGNSANTKGRGTSYAINRLKRQLRRHYRRYGNEGYILLVDYHDYFASIPHYKLLGQARQRIDDKRIIHMISQFLAAEETSIGIGLGAEPNQVFAVSYPNRIDHWLDEMSGCMSGRYMDDIYAINISKTCLWSVLGTIISMSTDLGLTLNHRKTKIVKLSHGWTWLKKRWKLTDTGRIIVRPLGKVLNKQRRKMRGLSSLVERGYVSLPDWKASYMSWRGGLKGLNAYKSLRRMDAYYAMLTARLEATAEQRQGSGQ